MVRFLAAIAVAFAAWTAGHPAAAQEFDAEKLDLARQVLNTSRTGRPFDELLPDIAAQAKTTFIQSNPQMQLGIIEVVDKVALDMVVYREELDAKLTRVWALAFETEELQTLLEFYRTPAGKKFALALPRLLTTQVGMADLWARELGQEMHKRVAAELKAAAEAEKKRIEAGGGNAAGSGLKLKPQ